VTDEERERLGRVIRAALEHWLLSEFGKRVLLGEYFTDWADYIVRQIESHDYFEEMERRRLMTVEELKAKIIGLREEEERDWQLEKSRTGKKNRSKERSELDERLHSGEGRRKE
jgi:hypothetical protein